MQYNNSMAEVTVSAARLKSLFDNRHKDVVAASKQLSLKTNLVEATISDTSIPFEELEVLAKYFKKPWSYLLIDKPEVIPNFGHDNRTVENKKHPVSEEILQELQAAEAMLDTMIELFPQNKINLPKIEIGESEIADTSVNKIREFLNVTDKKQLGCKNEYEALRLWAEAIQETGIYVSQRGLIDENIRAFSLARKNQAVIVISTKDSAYARIFSLLHEYCHVLLRNTGVCDLNEEHSRTESRCNHFAASVLLPDSLVNEQLKGFKFVGDIEEDEETIKTLSNHFRVSQATLLIRLKSVGLLGDSYYAKLETRRRSRRRNTKGSGGDYYASAINRVGRKFARDIFGALSDGKINRSDASAVLGVGEHIVGRFKDRLYNTPRTSHE
jgi:Zn-dependent peptidase ImmA (M78 family)